MNELALFAGAGGGILGGHLLGWKTICAVEWEPYPASVLCARQNDKVLPPFPIWDDVQTFDGRPWRGVVDVVSGGFPCQDISSAGKGAGIDGARSGMWFHMARIVSEVRPKYVYVENSPLLTKRGIHRVLGDLAAMGFDAKWGVVSAAAVGAPHKRDRIWIVANSTERRCEVYKNSKGPSDQFDSSSDEMADSGDIGSQFKTANGNLEGKRSSITSLGCEWWDREPGQTSREVESNLGRVAHGVAARVDRLKAIGNGQVPAVAATAFRLLGG